MRYCGYIERLCDRLIFSQAITFADGTLTINLPAGSYTNCERYCIVLTQVIPEATTITAPVVITVGTGTDEYPLTNCAGVQVTANALHTRTKYTVRIATTATGGSFQILGHVGCPATNNLAALDGGAAAAGGGA